MEVYALSVVACLYLLLGSGFCQQIDTVNISISNPQIWEICSYKDNYTTESGRGSRIITLTMYFRYRFESIVRNSGIDISLRQAKSSHNGS